MSWALDCPFCRIEDVPPPACPGCGGPLDARSTGSLTRRDGRGVWRYRELLPRFSGEPVTLFEGETPLYDCRGYSLKFEGANPTGSFKDRGMTVAVSLARAGGARRLVCASTGNTSASLAAYAARAGLEAVAYLPEGKVARGKLAQAIACGMRVVAVGGNFDAAFFRAGAEPSGDSVLMNSINPARIEGQKTLAFEVCDQLGRAPDAVVVPVGNGGNLRFRSPFGLRSSGGSPSPSPDSGAQSAVLLMLPERSSTKTHRVDLTGIPKKVVVPPPEALPAGPCRSRPGWPRG